VDHDVVPAWRRRTLGEHRWHMAAAVAVAVVLQWSLPPRFAVPPSWLLPALGAGLLIGLVVASPGRIDHRAARLRSASIALIIVMSLGNAGSALRLITRLVEGTAGEEARPLLLSGAAIWLTNVIVFALWYWEFDRGGPAARAHGVHHHLDLAFPQQLTPEVAPPDWEPRFFDYVYLSFTNATAFSPTDVLPLARWAKATMMLQSAVSLTTVALVIARAVNILQ
jgi:uncharacterized membrane protein